MMDGEVLVLKDAWDADVGRLDVVGLVMNW